MLSEKLSDQAETFQNELAQDAFKDKIKTTNQDEKLKIGFLHFLLLLLEFCFTIALMYQSVCTVQ